MNKYLLFLSAVIITLFLFPEVSYAQIVPQMSTPLAVVSTPKQDFTQSIIEDNAGNIQVFYVGYGSDSTIKLYQTTYSGGSFSDPVQVAVPGISTLSAVTALKDSIGAINLIITKGSSVGHKDLFWTNNSGGIWSTPVRLTDYADNDTEPSLVDTGSGNLLLVFSRLLNYDIYGNVLLDNTSPGYFYSSPDLYQMTYSGGSWSSAIPVVSTPGYSESHPTLAQGPSGKIYMSYASSETGTWDLAWREYNAGVWSDKTTILNGSMGHYLQEPSLIKNKSNTYNLVYSDKILCTSSCSGTYTSQIGFITFDPVSNTWSSPSSLTDRTQFYADSSSITVDTNGILWLAFRYLSATSYDDTANTDIYWMKSLDNTPAGVSTQVDLGSGSPVASGSSITFSEVTVPGNTTLITSDTNPGDTTGVFQVSSTYSDIITTASYSGNLTISLHYDDTGMTLTDEQNLKLLHWKTATQTWEDATTSVDTVNNFVNGTVTSLSWFTIVKAPSLTWLPPITNIKEGDVYSFNDGSTLPIKFNLKNSSGEFVYNPKVSVVVSGNRGSVTFIPGIGSDEIRYDATTGEYIVNLQTKNYSFIVPGQEYKVNVSSSDIIGSNLSSIGFTTLIGGKAQGKK